MASKSPERTLGPILENLTRTAEEKFLVLNIFIGELTVACVFTISSLFACIGSAKAFKYQPSLSYDNKSTDLHTIKWILFLKMSRK